MENNCTIILGGKWGDEGKGKVASKESENASLVIRATGGANAGHTIVFEGNKIALHLVPGGIVYPQTMCLIGQGVVIDIPVLLKEIKTLKNKGIKKVKSRLKISSTAHIVFPYHKELDQLHENLKANPIGTTKRGIGPCYADKDYRTGIRIMDLLRPEEELEKLIDEATKLANQNFKNNGMEDAVVDPKALAKEYHEYGTFLKSMIVDGNLFVRKYVDSGEKIVIEGAQAYRLDKDFGDYPNVTSSNCVTAGCLIGAHLPCSVLDSVIITVKGYDTRVGNGPFPTEQMAHVENNKVLEYDEPYVGDVIREFGHEYGATTGRPRRCGWFDAVMLKSAKYVLSGKNTYLCINHMDTLGKLGNELGSIKICVGYRYQGKRIDYYPSDIEVTGQVPMPIYETFEGGWDVSSEVREYRKLPKKMREVIKFIEDYTGIPVKYIGVGPGNDDLVVRKF